MFNSLGIIVLRISAASSGPCWLAAVERDGCEEDQRAVMPVTSVTQAHPSTLAAERAMLCCEAAGPPVAKFSTRRAH